MTDHQKLKSLRRFIVTDDRFFPGKKKLKVKGKDLENLSKEIFYITELEVLDLSPEREACLEYQLHECPVEVGKLINLRVLMLDTNELYDIPSSITRLMKLEKLSLSNNRIHVLPHGFSSLINLTSLHLSNNKFTEFPIEVCGLFNLQFLDISDNEVSRLPPDIASLKELHSLLIFNNKLDSLPDSIATMRNLRCLWIGDNKITRLPRNFAHLNLTDWNSLDRHMYSTVVDGNPLTEPPMDICKQGINAIANYFGTSCGSDTGRYDFTRDVSQNSKRGGETYRPVNENLRNGYNEYGSTPSLGVPQSVSSQRTDDKGGYYSGFKGHGSRVEFSPPGRGGGYTDRSNGVRAPYNHNTAPRNKYK